jgi:hypothetical protein
VSAPGLTVATFDAIERTRAALTVAIAQALLRLSRLDARRSREEAARLYAVLDAAIEALREIARHKFPKTIEPA